MTDYGHPLSFGSFTTPTNADPDRTVGLAVLAEQVGFDLVTFQDHPYLPTFFDTWTLLSFIAARTTRVRLAANVTNLPLRPPAVLARSVASLDLLTDGRVELGLGAGAFPDGVRAMGGRALTAGESVRALEEAIDVVRQIWDVGAPGGVRVDGEFYHVVGAKRGPAPAHPIAIWLGAYKPRMLALTGRRADGWLPSLSYLQPGDLAAGNAMIDEAAEQAGRAPGEIRRLLNISGEFSAMGTGALHGPPEQWAEELAGLAIDDGISTFILGTDDPDDLRRFAAEVAPAVRELVAAERAPTPTPAPAPRPAPTQVAVSGVVPGDIGVVPTPDDGTRRSNTQVWDESTRPSGPAPATDARYTTQGRASARQLVAVHDHLRGELAQIHDLIAEVAAGTRDIGSARSHINKMTMRQNNWTLGTYCESYCRVVTTHHTIEDQGVFPYLRRRDPALAAVADRLEQEHVTIHDVLEGVDRALVALVDGGELAELRDAVDLLSDTLLSHLAYEERELVEPLARLGFGF
jgi:alkanesulfonate monooxygenase SsuD/methylene tetrahydromethanopterin reductase-like flavin-dependent oxidoreductase (luciferase family)